MRALGAPIRATSHRVETPPRSSSDIAAAGSSRTAPESVRWAQSSRCAAPPARTPPRRPRRSAHRSMQHGQKPRSLRLQEMFVQHRRLQKVFHHALARHPPSCAVPGHRKLEWPPGCEFAECVAHERRKQTRGLRGTRDDPRQAQRTAVDESTPTVVRDQELYDALVGAVAHGGRRRGVLVDEGRHWYAVHRDTAREHEAWSAPLPTHGFEQLDAGPQVNVQTPLELPLCKPAGDAGQMKDQIWPGFQRRRDGHPWVAKTTVFRTRESSRNSRELPIQKRELLHLNASRLFTRKQPPPTRPAR